MRAPCAHHACNVFYMGICTYYSAEEWVEHLARTARKRGAKTYEEKEQVSTEEITALAFGVAIAIVASFLLLQAISLLVV